MSGTIPLSLTQQFDVYGQPLAGGQLYLIQAGTVSTPQDGFQDPALTIKMPYPITLDQAGRIPQFFLADGFIKVRLQDVAGIVQLAADNIQVIGPSSGGGGGGTTVDPTQLIQTGNMIFRYGFGSITGYVRLNGLTIGSVTSGSTERANADCQALYNYLWGIDPNLVVSGGRGATALADWTANKQLAVPDWRGYAPAGLDDMGNTPAGRLTATYFGANATTLGAAGGAESHILNPAEVQIPVHQHNVYSFDQGHNHGASPNGVTGSNGVQGGGTFSGGTSPSGISIGIAAAAIKIGSAPGATDNLTAPSPAGAAALPHTSLGPRKLCTFYIKL